MDYVVKMDGMKIRMFKDPVMAKAWAKKHCHGKVEIVGLKDCGRLPRACGKMFPNLEMNGKGLVYKPFVDVGLREVGRVAAR